MGPIVEQHRQQCAASGVSGQRGDRHDGDTRRGGSANVIEEGESGEALSTFTGKPGGEQHVDRDEADRERGGGA